MKKKLLFLGLMVALFMALFTVSASAANTLQDSDLYSGSCTTCSSRLSQFEPFWDFHCSVGCSCIYEICPDCGEHTMLNVFCGNGHNSSINSSSNRVYCKNCSFVISPLVHAAFSAEYTEVTIEPTCSNYGFTYNDCLTCATSLGVDSTVCHVVCKFSDQIPPLDHQLNITITPATCQSVGFTSYSCNTCDLEYIGNIVEFSCNYVRTFTTATCTEGGISTYTCPLCHDSYETEEGPLGHSIIKKYGSDYCVLCNHFIDVTFIRQIMIFINSGFQIFGSGAATGFSSLFDVFLTSDGHLTTLASTAFAIAGFALIAGVAFAIIKRRKNK